MVTTPPHAIKQNAGDDAAIRHALAGFCFCQFQREKKASEARRIRSGLKLGLGKQVDGWKRLELLIEWSFSKDGAHV